MFTTLPKLAGRTVTHSPCGNYGRHAQVLTWRVPAGCVRRLHAGNVLLPGRHVRRLCQHLDRVPERRRFVCRAVLFRGGVSAAKLSLPRARQACATTSPRATIAASGTMPTCIGSAPPATMTVRRARPTAWSKSPPSSARAWPLRLLRVRQADLTGSALPGERPAHRAPSHCLGCSSQPLQSCPFPCL